MVICSVLIMSSNISVTCDGPVVCALSFLFPLSNTRLETKANEKASFLQTSQAKRDLYVITPLDCTFNKHN